MSRDLLVFGEDWAAHPSSTQHLVGRLCGDRRVLWVNSIGLRRPRLDGHDLVRAARKVSAAIMGRRPSRRPQPPGPAILSPLAIPASTGRTARTVNRALLGRSLRQATARAGIERPVLWASLPTAVDALEAVPLSGSVYYCGDDFSSLPGVDHAAVSELEAELVRRVDLVVTASDVMAARFPEGKTRLLPHGVDLSLFATPAHRAPDLPADGPIAGFYGSIQSWIDVELLGAVADRLPDWTLVLIGAAHVPVEALAARPNVRLLGPRPHCDLPSYAQHWTVSLVPFRDTPSIRACNPLKLREYLAAGRPVVSTPFPALSPYLDVVRVAQGPDAFASAVEAARAAPPDDAARRRERVRMEDWDARAAEIARWIDAL